MKRKLHKSEYCLNCETRLHGENYCPQCGQLNNTRLPGFWDFLQESLSNFFALDGKFFKSLKVLFRKPGYLPTLFMDGQRVRYMHPVRMYFFSSILLLFVINLQNDNDTIIDTQKEERLALGDSTLRSEVIQLQGKMEDPGENTVFNRLKLMYLFASLYPEEKAEAALDSLHLSKSWWHRFSYEQAYKAANLNDDAFSEYFYSKLFWVLFLFLPVFALCLKVLYWRRNYFYLEHLFFAFYTQSAFFLLLSAGLTLRNWWGGMGTVVALMIFSLYLLLALRNFYRQSWLKTSLKYILLNGSYVILFMVFVMSAIFLSFIFY